MKYTTTEEMVMVPSEEGLSYKCARVETFLEGDNYPRQVGYIRLPVEVFDKVVKLIENE